MPPEYDAKAGFLATSLCFSHTVLPHVLCSLEFWFLLGVHAVVCGCFRIGLLDVEDVREDGVLYLNWFDLRLASSITTFLLVLYLNQCYSRYLKIHQLTRSMLVAVYDFTFQLRLYLRPHGLPYDRLACRWLCSTVMIFFYQSRNGGMTLQAWGELERLGMLTADEVSFLQAIPPGQRKAVATNCVGDISRTGLQAAGVPWNNTRAMMDKLLAFRDQQQRLTDTVGWPVPFQYFHLLQFTVLVNLLVWAYGLGTTDSVIAPFYFICAELIYMSLLDLAAILANPFAADSIDNHIGHWIAELLENMSALVEYEHDGAGDWRQELDDERTARMRIDLQQKDVETLLGIGDAGSRSADGAGRAKAYALAANARQVQSAGYAELPPASDEARVDMHRSSPPFLPAAGPGGAASP